MRKSYFFVIVLIALTIFAGYGKQWFFLDSDSVSSEFQVDNQQKITLRFGHNTPEDSALHQAALRFAAIVQEKTNNQVQVDVFPSQILGNDHKMVEMAREGKLDILLTPTAKMSVPLPAMQYADLPFFFPSREDTYALLDGEPGRLLLDKLDKIDLVGVTFWENGFKHFTGNTPFLEPSDFAGKKIRVMKSDIIMDQFRSLEAEPVPIDFHATRQALLDKAVDGQENPLVAIVSMGFHEVQSDFVLSEHAYLGYVFSISKKVFNQLPQDVQIVLIETAKEVTPWEREETQRREQGLLAKIREAGVRIHTLTADQRQAFVDKVSWIAKAAEGVIGVDIMSKTEEYLQDKYGPTPESKQQVVIGLNADLSMDGKGLVGLAFKRGIELALDEINSQGGALGKPMKLIARDHRITSSMGINNLQYFSAREDVLAVIGGKQSAVIVEELPYIQESKMPYLIPWAVLPELTENGYQDNYVFRLSVNDRYVSPFFAKYVTKRFKRTAIIVENTVWGRSNLESIAKHMTDNGVAPEVLITLNRGQKDLTREFNQVLEAKCDSIMLVVDSNDGANFIEKLAQLDSSPVVISHWGVMGGNFYEKVGHLLPNLDFRFFQTDLAITKRSRFNDLMARYRQSYHLEKDETILSSIAVARAYDLTHLIALAVEQAGSYDRSSVKHALENLPAYEGALKNYSKPFSKGNHDALKDEGFFMARFNNSGTIVPVSE